uniref:integrase core domain-containing protein n=1 Tax=Xanthomonas euvesicatoria TaxID=456327 RepID=UPI0013DE9195
PMQNGFIERFNGSYRRGVLDMHLFRTLSEVREQTEHWLADYNRVHPRFHGHLQEGRSRP